MKKKTQHVANIAIRKDRDGKRDHVFHHVQYSLGQPPERLYVLLNHQTEVREPYLLCVFE